MAITWSWSKKIGEWKEVQRGREFTFNIYSGGNCPAVIIYEFEEEGTERYQIQNFFADKTHLRNCLGLNKGYDNIYADSKIELNLDKSKDSKLIASEFIKAKFNNPIKITIG